MVISEGQPLSAAESSLVRWLLEHGEVGAARFLPTVDALRVVNRCSCGCASIDFTADESGPMTILADFGLQGLGGVPGGVFLFTRGGRLAGLDVYSFGDPIAQLPEPSALVPLPLGRNLPDKNGESSNVESRGCPRVPTRPMWSYRTIAEAYYRLLAFGLVDVAEVISWVDKVIVAEPRPAFAWIEASSSGGDPAALMSALREVPGVADAAGRRRLIFGIMQRALDRDAGTIKPVLRALYAMAIDDDVPDPEGGRCMWHLDDAWDLAELGYYGHTEGVRRDLVQFLDRYTKGL